jgi:hypothetical protein
MKVAERGNESQDLGFGCGPRNYFGQVKVSRRIEEMRAEEMLTKLRRIALSNAA